MTTAESVVRYWDQARSTDRRRHPRVGLESPVLLDNLKEWSRASCRNISMGGVAVRCERVLAIGERLEIYLELPNGFAVEAVARVVRTGGEDAGLQFLSMGNRASLALRALCRPDASER